MTEPAMSGATSAGSASARSTKPVRLAVVGGRRGQSFHRSLDRLADKAHVVAVCDLDENVLREWRDRLPDVSAYLRYEDLLEDAEVDAVLLATPLQLHATQAITALRAGRHVLSEVTAARTLEECWELVETVDQTGRTYMMAENYCFMRPNLMVENMAAQGLFGELTHLEGGYIHDTRSLLHHPDGSLTWRGDLRAGLDSISYPTHSMGPVARWLRAGNGPDDRFEVLTAFTSDSPGKRRYFDQRFGADHPAARRPDYWQQGDSGTALIHTTKGVVVTIRVDSSPRPHNMTHYGLQGSRGAYLSARHDGEDPLVWIEGLSPGASESLPGQEPARWDSLWKHAPEYEHPLWRERLTDALDAGHGGGDFFVIDEFVTAITEGRPPAVDVRDAVTWSCVAALSAESIAGGGKPISFPDFGK
ncbi:Gfo/Idh/MocA family protein [Actinopolymorpha pittospori]